MKIDKKQLQRIVQEEFVRWSRAQLAESPSHKPGIDLPDEDDVPSPEGAPEEKLPQDSPAPEASDDEPSLPDQDTGTEDDPAGEDEPEPGPISQDLQGKRIAGIEMSEKSEIMPGAAEIVFTFDETPDALRILVTKTGQIKYFYKGLHNDLGPTGDAPEEPEGEPVEEPAEEPPAPEEDELDDVPPLGDEDMPPEEDERDRLKR
jgi:hypothetical protein